VNFDIIDLPVLLRTAKPIPELRFIISIVTVIFMCIVIAIVITIVLFHIVFQQFHYLSSLEAMNLF
jgi:hypothetical protein